jgi:hypothetical protein
MNKAYPCENEDCEFFETLSKGAHCAAEDYCGGYYNDKEAEQDG